MTPYDELDYDAELTGLNPALIQRGRSAALRKQPLTSMPTGGVETPKPQPMAPGAALNAPAMQADDYRSRSLKLLEQASETTPQETDVTGLREFAKDRDEASNRRLMLGMALQAQGGKSLGPSGGHILQQALAAQEPMKFAGGMIERGQFIADPQAAAQSRSMRLEAQARLYETMAAHAETTAQREAATKAAADLRREIQNATASRAQERADELRGSRSFTQENQLRDDFEKQVKDQRISLATYPQIEAALTQKVPTAASDMRAIFRYMKMLDPTSVVREGEFATAKNAAGIPERIMNVYNRALSGTMLSENQRSQFLDQARSERDVALNFFNERAGEFGSRARGYGLNPRNVVLGYDGAGAPAQAGGGAAPAAGGPPPGAVREKTR